MEYWSLRIHHEHGGRRAQWDGELSPLPTDPERKHLPNMATLAAALDLASSARLVRGDLVVVVSEDLDGECAVTVQAGDMPPGPPRRYSNLAEVLAYLARGVAPGVRGDEPDWEPLST